MPPPGSKRGVLEHLGLSSGSAGSFWRVVGFLWDHSGVRSPGCLCAFRLSERRLFLLYLYRCSIYVEQRREKVKKGSSSLKTYAEVLNQKEKQPTVRKVAGEKALVQVFTKAGKMLREVDSKKGWYKTREWIWSVQCRDKGKQHWIEFSKKKQKNMWDHPALFRLGNLECLKKKKRRKEGKKSIQKRFVLPSWSPSRKILENLDYL